MLLTLLFSIHQKETKPQNQDEANLCIFLWFSQYISAQDEAFLVLPTTSLNTLGAITPWNQAMQLGICVKTCPQYTFQYNASGVSLAASSYITSYDSRITYPVYYQSSPVYYRCVPSYDNGIYSVASADIKTSADQLVSALALTEFVRRGVEELGGVCTD